MDLIMRWRQALLFTVLSLLILCSQRIYGQTGASLQIPVLVTDSSHHTSTVYFGVNPSASYCIDPALGEFELPANRCGSAQLCVYFSDVRTGPDACLGNGLLVDLRGFTSPAQTDSYKIVFTTPDYPVTLRWPPNLGISYDTILLRDGVTGSLVAVDMKKIDSVVIKNPVVNFLLIFAEGPHGVFDAVTESASEPLTMSLSQNFPNPFNPSTVIRYKVSASGRVSLVVYDLLGRIAATLVDGEMHAGEYQVAWNPVGKPGGIYYYRLTTSRGSITHSMIYLP
jgi:hypothetical protein